MFLVWHGILGLSSRRLHSSDVLWGQNSLWLLSPDFLTSSPVPQNPPGKEPEAEPGHMGALLSSGTCALHPPWLETRLIRVC